MLYPEYPLLPTGWASYGDTQYTALSPFAVATDTDTVLPNNAGAVVTPQLPYHVPSFYANGRISGRNGDNLDVMVFFKAVPSNPAQFLDVWIDMGSPVGEQYRQTFAFAKGAGVEMGIMYSLASAYTLDTWQANGAQIKVRTNHPLDIYGIRFNFDRSHKAR